MNMNEKETAETGPIRSAMIKAAEVIDQKFYGAFPDGFEAPFLQAKYRAKGIDPDSDPWNQKTFAATEEALAPYAEALVNVLDREGLRQGMPKDLVEAREAMRAAVVALATKNRQEAAPYPIAEERAPRIPVVGNMPADRKGSIYTYATRNTFVDHNDQFTVAGGDDVKTLKTIHVEPGERGQPGAIPAHGAEGETYVLIRLEDQSGERHRLTECAEVVGIRHVPGILYHDPILSQTWVIPLDEEEMISGEVPDLPSKTPVRLYGAAPSAVEDMGPLPSKEWISEGEFYISDEDSPVLIAVAWQSEVGVYAEGFETPEKLSKDEALKAAVRQSTADLDTSLRM